MSDEVTAEDVRNWSAEDVAELINASDRRISRLVKERVIQRAANERQAEVLGCLVAVLELTWSEEQKLAVPEFQEAKENAATPTTALTVGSGLGRIREIAMTNEPALNGIQMPKLGESLLDECTRLKAEKNELLEALIEMRVALEDPSALSTLQLITIVAKADGAIAKARGTQCQ